ncbi:MAG: hypothetical protein AABX47_09455 [Nanoarchaeota archaeon]
MLEAIENAKEELKRADHLMYVSLKYTRTVDVLKSIVERLINAFDFLIDSLLKAKKVKDIPKIPKLKVEAVKKCYTDVPAIASYMDFYLLLRSVDRATFERTLEYRRHVTMTAHLDDKEIEIDIDIIEDYFHKAKEFVSIVEGLIGEKKND